MSAAATPEKTGKDSPYNVWDAMEEAVVMLSIHLPDKRILLPYISLSEVVSLDDQVALRFGEEVEIQITFGEATPVNPDDLMDKLMDHRVQKIYNDKKAGVSIKAIRKVRDEEGVVTEEPFT